MSAGLGDVSGRFGDLVVAVGVAEFACGDAGQGVAALDDDRPRFLAIVHGRDVQPHPWSQEVRPAVEDVGVQPGDLTEPAAVAQVAVGQRPQRVARPHHMGPGRRSAAGREREIRLVGDDRAAGSGHLHPSGCRLDG